MQVGFADMADVRNGQFAKPGPLVGTTWDGGKMVMQRTGNATLSPPAPGGVFTMPAGGVAEYKVVSTGPGEAVVSSALISAVIRRTGPGGGIYEEPVIPARVGTVGSRVAAGIIDVSQSIVTGRPNTPEGFTVDLGLALLPVYGDGRDIILNVGRGIIPGGEGFDQLEFTFAALGLIGDLPVLDVSIGPLAAVAKQIVKVSKAFCRRAAPVAPIMAYTYAEFAQRLPAILGDLVGLPVGARSDDYLKQLRDLLTSTKHLHGMTDDELLALDRVFVRTARKEAQPGFRRLVSDFGDEQSLLLYKNLAVLAGDDADAAGHVLRVLSRAHRKADAPGLVTLIKGLDTADTAHFVQKLGGLFKVVQGEETKKLYLVGKDVIRFRRMLEAANVFDPTAYSGTVFNPARKGLKELLDDFNLIRGLDGGQGQIRRCFNPIPNFSRGYRGEIDDALKEVAQASGNINQLKFSRWIDWDSVRLGRETKTDVDWVFDDTAYFRKSSVHALQREPKRKLSEVIEHTKAGLLERHGISVETVIIKVPGGEAAVLALEPKLPQKLKQAAADGGVTLRIEDSLDLAPRP